MRSSERFLCCCSMKSFSRFFSGTCLFLTLLVLAGWQFDVEFLKRPLSGLGGMNPTTALCFVFSSISVLLFCNEKKTSHYLGYTLAGVCLLITGYRLAEGWFLYSAYADQTLFLEKLKEEGMSTASRMSPNGAVTFILLNIAMVLLSLRRAWVGQLLTLIAVLIAWFTLLGYLYKVPEFYGLLTYLPMSLHTAFCFILLAFALLAFHRDKGVVKELNSNLAGGRLAKIFLPIVFIVPVLFGYLRLWLYWKNIVSTELGVALLSVSIILVFAILIIINITLMNRQDAARKNNEEALAMTNLSLSRSSEEIAALNEEMVAANEEMNAANEELTMMNEQLHAASEKIQEQAAIIVQQKDEHLNKALDSTNVIIWSIDLTGQGQSYMSRSAEKISGIPVNELLTQRDAWNRLVVPEDFEIRNAALRRLEEEGYTESTFRLRDKDGKIRWINFQLTTVRDETGKAIRQDGMVLDITSLKESELALAQERNLLRSLIDNVPDYIFVKDTSLRYLVNNKANLELLKEVNEENSRSKTSLDYFGAAAESFHKDDLRILAKGESILNKEEIIQSGEETRIVLTTKVPLRDGMGTITGIIGISRDVTESRKSEQLLNQYRENLDVIFRSTLEEILLLDKEGKVVLFNNALEKFITSSTGKKPVVGNYLWDTTVPERSEMARHLFRQALEGRAITSDAYIKSPGGMLIHELRYQPIYIGNEVKYVMLISLDITERRNQENSVRKSEANLRAIFDTTTDSFILLDSEFNIQAFNESFRQSTTLHLELKEGMNLIGLVPESRREIFGGYLNQAKQGKVVEYEIQGNQKDKVTWHQVVISPVKDSYNHVIGICITSHDLTLRKHAEEERSDLLKQLIERNNDLLQFSFIASHNLRGPVASMLGLLNLLNHEQLSEEASQLLSLISNSVHRLDTVIGDLSLILSMRGDELEAKEWVRMSDLIDIIKTTLQSQISESEATIMLSDQQAHSFFAIKSYLHSILYNLISNSIKYRSGSRKPVIEVSTFRDEAGVGFIVKDNGRGIDVEKFRDKIFKLYQRFHLDVEGKGLGLYMVHTQTRALNGTISVQSEPDRGAVFTIRFADGSVAK